MSRSALSTTERQAIRAANGALVRAAFALIWVFVMMHIARIAIPPGSGVMVIAMLLMFTPGVIVAIAAMRKAGESLSISRTSVLARVRGRRRSVFAILIAVTTLVMIIGTILVAIGRTGM